MTTTQDAGWQGFEQTGIRGEMTSLLLGAWWGREGYVLIINKKLSLSYGTVIDWLIYLLKCLFGSEGHVALNRNAGLGYNTLLLRLIPGDLSACPHRQFHTLSSLLDSQLHCQTPTLTHAGNAGRQFVPFLWPGRDVNPRPTVWEAEQ